MRINIDLSKKSIENAIKQIKAAQKKVQKDLPRVFLGKCAEWIKAEANNNLSRIPMDGQVINLIQSRWEISPVVGNMIKISNTAKYQDGRNIAVFVEFGVGVVGQSSPKEPDFQREAIAKSGYQYNLPSDYKRSSRNPNSKYHNNEDAWRFYISPDKGVDLHTGYYEEYETSSGNTKIVTAGSPANMFLFKAWKTFETSGAYKTLWEQAKAEVIG